jgi:cytidylate kinase
MLTGFYVAEGTDIRVAISGSSGCGNTSVSRILAETLDIAFINFTFRSLAQEMHIPLSEIIEKAKTDFTYDRMVDEKQLELARSSSCVLGSRLAIWMLTDADIKVYLTASEEVRVKRIMNREGGTYEENRIFTALRDAEDTRRYRELYGIDNTEYSFADLIINTENYTPDQIVLQILEKLEGQGLVKRG